MRLQRGQVRTAGGARGHQGRRADHRRRVRQHEGRGGAAEPEEEGLGQNPGGAEDERRRRGALEGVFAADHER